MTYLAPAIWAKLPIPVSTPLRLGVGPKWASTGVYPSVSSRTWTVQSTLTRDTGTRLPGKDLITNHLTFCAYIYSRGTAPREEMAAEHAHERPPSGQKVIVLVKSRCGERALSHHSQTARKKLGFSTAPTPEPACMSDCPHPHCPSPSPVRPLDGCKNLSRGLRTRAP